MGKPLSFETELSQRRIREEVEAIESEIRPGDTSGGYISSDGIVRLRELRIALETKPLVQG